MEQINTEQTTQAENMGNEVQETTQENKRVEQKMFTQEEVNGFVQNRVSRMRGQIEKESKAEYEQKLADLHAREIKLLIREKLDKRDMPRDLADIITCTDEKDLDAKLDVLQGIYKQKRIDEERAPSGFRPLIGVEPTDKPSKGLDPIRNAMGLN